MYFLSIKSLLAVHIGASREMEVFLKYYSRLINILSSTVNNIKHELVSLRIIDQGDIEEINGTLRSKDKVAVILKKIQNHLEEGNAESFYALLNEMEKFHTNDDLVNEIRGEIKTGKLASLLKLFQT